MKSTITCIITPNSEILFAKVIRAIAKVATIVPVVSIDMYCDTEANSCLLQALVNSLGLRNNIYFKNLNNYEAESKTTNLHKLVIASNIATNDGLLLSNFNQSIPVLLVYNKQPVGWVKFATPNKYIRP